jgi:hypothetical protein
MTVEDVPAVDQQEPSKQMRRDVPSHPCAQCVALRAALEQLASQWGDGAVWEVDHGSPEFGKGRDQCAEELRALLAAPPQEPT